ncbi:MAG: LytR C-terminal domain-containing protein [Candidatus Shapirobacteria bacterium]|nr:LytR C-terminal domain-containing protein [Candidatus Shapirobacteria bacterium]
MSLFSKPKVVIWPKLKTTEVYLDRKENNVFIFDVNLWQDCNDTDLHPLVYFLKENKIDTVSILVPDDVVLTKSFIYDTKIEKIDQKEVIGLAESFVTFKIDPDAIEYQLIQTGDKTIIQSTIFEKSKTDFLKNNLSKLSLKSFSLQPVSASISIIINSFYQKEFFLIYPLNNNEYTLILAKDKVVYLTANIKGSTLDIKKIINYSHLYFSSPVDKLFVPQNKNFEINDNIKLEKTEYNESQIASEFHKAANLPIPVIGLMTVLNLKTADIIKQPSDINSNPKMENKKNILPVVAVFIFTAALASIVIWFVLNRNSGDAGLQNPVAQNNEAIPAAIEVIPTETPIPSIVEVSKSLKLQVLNATDINGQAATVKAQLTALGFTSVAVGNSNEKVTGNEVRLKPSLSSSSAYFKNKIDAAFPATYTTDLKETSAYDAVFVIGTDLSKTATSATPTATKTAPTPTTEL